MIHSFYYKKQQHNSKTKRIQKILEIEKLLNQLRGSLFRNKEKYKIKCKICDLCNYLFYFNKLTAIV